MRTATATGRFDAFTRAVVRRLPDRLERLVAPTFVGFVVLNLLTFALDLGLLSLLHGPAGWPLAAAVTVAYGTALLTSYALNRVANFRSRAPVGPQLVRYVVVVVANYLVCVLGTTSALSAAGVDYRLSRAVAGVVEAGVMYPAMRWVVFR